MQLKSIVRLLCCGMLGWSLPTAFSQERHRLYTVTNPADTGGIKGHMSSPYKPIQQILAMPPNEPRFVYEGKVLGAARQDFLFESLPMALYDLLVVYEDDFYEGLELHPEKSTLTKTDLEKIENIISESQPFFTQKIIHRIAGTTGRGQVARCLCTFLRGNKSTGTASHRAGLEYMRDQSSSGWRRTFKLVWLKDVGPGWQVVQTRDLYPVWTAPEHALPKHHFRDQLSRIRVTDSIKDLGNLDVETAPRKPGKLAPANGSSTPASVPVAEPSVPCEK